MRSHLGRGLACGLVELGNGPSMTRWSQGCTAIGVDYHSIFILIFFLTFVLYLYFVDYLQLGYGKVTVLALVITVYAPRIYVCCTHYTHTE